MVSVLCTSSSRKQGRGGRQTGALQACSLAQVPLLYLTNTVITQTKTTL